MVLTPELIALGLSALCSVITAVAIQKGWIKPPAPKPVTPVDPTKPVDPNAPLPVTPVPILPNNPILDMLLKALIELATRQTQTHDPIAQTLASDHEERLLVIEKVLNEKYFAKPTA